MSICLIVSFLCKTFVIADCGKYSGADKGLSGIINYLKKTENDIMSSACVVKAVTVTKVHQSRTGLL